MILIPLPTVVAIFLGFLLCFVVFQRERRLRAITVFLAASTALMIVVSLRWNFDAPVFRFLQPVIASLLPPAAWLSFSGLSGGSRRSVWPHFLPGAAIFLLSLFWQWVHAPIDAILACVFFGYGCALIWRGMQGEERFAGARLGTSVPPDRVATFVGLMLLLSSGTDLAIALDFELGEGTHAETIVSVSNMLLLPLVAWAVLSVTRNLPESDEPQATDPLEAQNLTGADDAHILAEFHRVLNERHLYRDPDLTLERLARRVGIPGRQISQAVNRRLGRNISQEINRWRIHEAQTLLEQSDRSVTEIMFECGFQTKSNFNTTFRRVTGLSPSDWRRRAKKSLSAETSLDPETR